MYKRQGVEPAEAASMKAAFAEGKPITLPSADTIADGTAVKKVGEKILPYAMENVDEILTVEDDELIGAFLDMVENHKTVSYTHLRFLVKMNYGMAYIKKGVRIHG